MIISYARTSPLCAAKIRRAVVGTSLMKRSYYPEPCDSAWLSLDILPIFTLCLFYVEMPSARISG